jgi:HAE1 family hydrophobic/amphiphilic exporter-1
LFLQIPKGFLPSEDQGRFNVTTEAVQGIGFDDMVRHQIQVADIISRDPNIGGLTNNVGQGGGINTGRMDVDLKPRAERTQTVDQIIAALRPQLAQVPGIRAYLVNRPPINLGGQGGARSLYQFTLQDTDTGGVPLPISRTRSPAAGSRDVAAICRSESADTDRHGSRQDPSLGLMMNQVGPRVQRTDSPVSQIYAPNNQYQNVMGRAGIPEDPAALSMLAVRSTQRQLISLNTLARVTTNVGPLSIAHTGQLPSVTISFNLRPGVALGDAVSAIQAAAAQTLPSTLGTSFQGTAQAFQDSLQGLGLILIMAIVVIYIYRRSSTRASRIR